MTFERLRGESKRTGRGRLTVGFAAVVANPRGNDRGRNANKNYRLVIATWRTRMFKDRDLCRPPTALRILQPANFRDAHRPKPVFHFQPLYIRESIASLQTTTTDLTVRSVISRC